MFDIIPTSWNRISHKRAARRRGRDLETAEPTSRGRVSFGETIAIGLGCDSRIPRPKRAPLS